MWGIPSHIATIPHLGRALGVLPAGCGGMTDKAIIINRLLAAPQGQTYQRPEIGVAPNRLLCRARSGLVPDNFSLRFR